MAKTNQNAVESTVETPATTNGLLEERLKVKKGLDESAIKSAFRGAKVLKASLKDFKELSIGIPNSGVKEGEIFRIIRPDMIEQPVGRPAVNRKMAIFHIENTKGEMRAIYASGLLRSTPTRSTEVNEYSDEVLNFDRGVLQNTSGLDFEKIFNKLVGDGSQYLRVTGTVAYVTKGVDNQGNDFIANNTSYALEHLTEAEAIDADNA